MTNYDELKKAAEDSNSDDCNVSADALAGWGDEILALLSEREKLLKVVEAVKVLLNATMYRDHPAESQLLIDALKELEK